jgi:hypothetical protein
VLDFMRGLEANERAGVPVCAVCRQFRNQCFDDSGPAPPGCHKIDLGEQWQPKPRRNMQNSLVCQRCAKLNEPKPRGKGEQLLAHAYSGIDSPVEDLSYSCFHNNMHMLPTACYFANCTEFMIMLIAKFSVAMNVHVLPRGKGLAQKGCLATITSAMDILTVLPRLPSEVGMLVITMSDARQDVRNYAKKLYAVDVDKLRISDATPQRFMALCRSRRTRNRPFSVCADRQARLAAILKSGAPAQFRRRPPRRVPGAYTLLGASTLIFT